MSFLPWQSFRLKTDLDADEVLRLLKRMIPARRQPRQLFQTDDVPYFWGKVDIESSSFQLSRNSAQRGAAFLPQLRGRVSPNKRGAVIQAEIGPSVGFFVAFGFILMSLFPFLAMIPFGLVCLIFGIVPNQNASSSGFILVGLMAVMMMSVLWGPLLLLTYLPMRPYRAALTSLVERMAERTPDGLSILEVEDTPEQVIAKRQQQALAFKQSKLLIAAVLSLLGFGIILFAAHGMVTGELRIQYQERHPESFPHRRFVTQTLTGNQAQQFARSLLALGCGVGTSSLVLWRVTLRDVKQTALPVLDTALLWISASLLVLSIVLGIFAFV